MSSQWVNVAGAGYVCEVGGCISPAIWQPPDAIAIMHAAAYYLCQRHAERFGACCNNLPPGSQQAGAAPQSAAKPTPQRSECRCPMLPGGYLIHDKSCSYSRAYVSALQSRLDKDTKGGNQS